MGFLTGVSNHALLSAVHTDALAGTVVRGDIVVGNSTPAWARFALGAANRVLFSDGTDPSWSASPTLTSLTCPTLDGGTAANADITIQGTTHSTRTTSFVLLQPSGGNVGITHSTPNITGFGTGTAVLTIAGSTGFGAIELQQTTPTTTSECGRLVFFSGTTQIAQIGAENESSLTLGGIVFTTGTSSERMRIRNTGVVGIGVTTPGIAIGTTWSGVRLHIKHTASSQMLFEGNAGAGIAMLDNAGTADKRFWQWFVVTDNIALRLWNDAESSVTTMFHADSVGNIGLSTTTFGTSAAKVLGIGSGTAPTTGPADTVQFYSTDDAAGHTIPSFFCEGTNVLATGQADSASSVRVKMRINGTVVTLLAI